jgi:hypothetical protein
MQAHAETIPPVAHPTSPPIEAYSLVTPRTRVGPPTYRGQRLIPSLDFGYLFKANQYYLRLTPAAVCCRATGAGSCPFVTRGWVAFCPGMSTLTSYCS